MPDKEKGLFYIAVEGRKGQKIIVTHGYAKQGDKLPSGEKKRAVKYREDYLARTKSGAYYKQLDEHEKGIGRW